MKKLIATLLLIGLLPQAPAASLPSTQRTDGRAVMAAFAEAGKVANQCKVSIMDGTKVLCIGTLITDDGLIITKHSEILGARQPFRIAGNDRRLHRGRLIAHDLATDLALIKANISYSSGIEWGSTEKLEIGHWLSAGVDARPGIRCGIVSAFTREIPKAGGALGIQMGKEGRDNGGVTVDTVTPESPAQKAGLRRGDIIYGFDKKEILTREKLRSTVQAHPGEKVTLSVIRDEKKQDIAVTLGYFTDVFGLRERNLKMSGKVSKRRGGFGTVIQHDITMTNTDIGGPLLSLEGKLLGINIARANRVEFFAIPAERVRAFLKEKSAAIKKAGSKL
jgi:serine protease Do